MKKSVISAIIALGFLASYAGAAVNFDQGVDVKAAIAASAEFGAGLPAADRYIGNTRYTRDCANFTFGPSDADLMTEKVWLRSMEYVEECHDTIQPGPNNGQVPVHHCYERPGMSWRRSARINVKARKLWPWESETFEVCLEGPRLDIYRVEAAYKYNLRVVNQDGAVFELTAQNKIPTRPDENGMTFGALSYAAGRYNFRVNDVWAKEYAGEKVSIKVDLYKDNPHWIDGYKGSKEFAFDVAAGYEMSFAADDLKTSDTEPRVSDENDRGPRNFYLKWGFKRIGSVSKDKFIKRGETPRVEVP